MDAAASLAQTAVAMGRAVGPGAGITDAACSFEGKSGAVRPPEDIERVLERYGSTVWRVCVLYFRASSDAQDAFQDTMVKYALADKTTFNDEEHCKAWLIRVATNTCKDMLKAAHRTDTSLEEGALESACISKDVSTQPSSFTRDVVDAMRALPDPPRTPLYLSLYEGYTAPEIARMIDAPLNTVYSWIARGKKQLKEALS